VDSTFTEWVYRQYPDITQVLLAISRDNEVIAILSLAHNKSITEKEVLDRLHYIYSGISFLNPGFNIDAFHVSYSTEDEDHNPKLKTLMIGSVELTENRLDIDTLLQKAVCTELL